MVKTLPLRRISALLVFFAGLALWGTESDLLKLIARQEQVLFGRYSQGHFYALVLITPVLWGFAAVLWSRLSLPRALSNFLLTSVSTIVSLLLFIYLSSLLAGPARYVEFNAEEDERARELKLAGVLRHRPPNERYELTFVDQPEQVRSYPNPPPGYGAVDIILTTDEHGFRNPVPSENHDLVVVGDSFAVGSNVSDDQGWVELLRQRRNLSAYNLGVSGSGPRTYLNNFVYYGLDLGPRRALFMIYEGNDFKRGVILPAPSRTRSVADGVADSAPPPPLRKRLGDHFSIAFKRSPITGGFRELSRRVFEPVNATRPIPGYENKMGFMPVRIDLPDGGAHYYSFEPKRLMRLYHDPDEWETSDIWQTTTAILDEFARRSEDRGIEPLFVYAPSKPHVVLPLVMDRIPAEQLWHFARYAPRSPSDQPERFKELMFERLDVQVNTFKSWCKSTKHRCLDLTPTLNEATSRGVQTYFTYDQHWTPDGNRIVADAIEAFLFSAEDGRQQADAIRQGNGNRLPSRDATGRIPPAPEGIEGHDFPGGL